MDPLSEVDTEDLVTRARAGDEASWVALTERYTNLLWSVARSMRLSHTDAADVVQTTWLRLVERVDSVRDPEHLASWLATTVRRESLLTLRRNARIRPAEPTEDAPSDADELDASLLRDERDAALWKAFRTLKPGCQTLLRVLMADPPPSYTDVSVALDMPVGSIGPTRQRCLNALRKLVTPAMAPSETPTWERA
jgi:RNA polymerase sigma factor (sigma-70 family)